MALSREDYYKGLIRFFEEEIRFNKHLGMTVEELDEGFARLRIPFAQDWIGDPFRPALHGGVVSTIADTAGGIAALTTVDPGDRLATVDLRVDYLRPAQLEDLVAEGKVVRIGNRVAACDMVVYQGDRDKAIATGKGVYNVKRLSDRS